MIDHHLRLGKLFYSFVCQGFFLKNDVICLAVEINERCSDSKQCQELNPHSICNFESDKCECQQGFIHQNDSCLPGVYELFIPSSKIHPVKYTR